MPTSYRLAPDATQLSRRERQIMDVIHAAREASVAEVLKGLPDPPSYSAVRALLRILVDKGHLKIHSFGGKYIYTPTRSHGHVAKSAMQRVLKTFFDNSASKAVAALLDASDVNLSHQELDQIEQLIDQAKKRGQA